MRRRMSAPTSPSTAPPATPAGSSARARPPRAAVGHQPQRERLRAVSRRAEAVRMATLDDHAALARPSPAPPWSPTAPARSRARARQSCGQRSRPAPTTSTRPASSRRCAASSTSSTGRAERASPPSPPWASTSCPATCSATWSGRRRAAARARRRLPRRGLRHDRAGRCAPRSASSRRTTGAPARGWFPFPAPTGRRRVTAYPGGEDVTVPRHVRTRRVTSRISTESIAPASSRPGPAALVPALRGLLRSPLAGPLDAVVGRLPEGPPEDSAAACAGPSPSSRTGRTARARSASSAARTSTASPRRRSPRARSGSPRPASTAAARSRPAEAFDAAGSSPHSAVRVVGGLPGIVDGVIDPAMTTLARHRVVVVGSGFGGPVRRPRSSARPLRRHRHRPTPHHLFQPLLYQVATGILSEGEIARRSTTSCATTTTPAWCSAM